MDKVPLILFQENTNGQMALLTRATSAKAICMERVFGSQVKETSMKAIILWMKSTALEGIHGKMELSMKGLSKMATSQVNLQAKQKIIEPIKPQIQKFFSIPFEVKQFYLHK